MTMADLFSAELHAQLGEPYIWGESGPDAHDCSGLYWEGMHAAGVMYKGKPFPRLTADDYYRMSTSISAPSKVGADAGYIVNKSGHAVHIIPYVGNGNTIEARGRKWGVVEYTLTDPINGALKRKAKWRRFPVELVGDITSDPPARRMLKITSPYMHGADVRAVQDFLGLPQSKRDGVYGPYTELAVKRMQKSNGLEVDGIVGPKTWAVLTGGH